MLSVRSPWCLELVRIMEPIRGLEGDTVKILSLLDVGHNESGVKGRDLLKGWEKRN